jgi:peptide deformylase
MVSQILVYPNKKLKQASKEVIEFDDKLHALLDDMLETMTVNNGIGLAAIQVGMPICALIIDLIDDEGNRVFEDVLEIINPKIIETSGEIKYKEGCLSVPEYYEEVTRFSNVTVEFFDRHGQQQTMETEGLLAIAFQHEMDHLKGKLFFERLSILKRKKFDKEYMSKTRV